MSSKHAGLGVTRPDTMPNTCLVLCHNPHQGVYKDGKWEDQTVVDYNKFAYKGKDIPGTEHTWRTFSNMNEEDCSRACHYGCELLVMHGKKFLLQAMNTATVTQRQKIRYGIEDRNRERYSN